MAFVPITFGTGLVGWNLLQQTMTSQKQVLSEDSVTQREIENFRRRFPTIRSAQQLVEDRAILNVALGAFGLQEDIQNRFFIQRILEEGVAESTALANLLSDNRYKEFADAFSFPLDDSERTPLIESIVLSYIDQTFQAAVGEQNTDFRLALNLQKDLTDIGNLVMSNDAKWFTILGNPPLRKVFEVAFRLPASVGSLSIDDQLGIFQDRSSSAFGTLNISDFSNPLVQEDIVNSFLLQSQLSTTTSLDSRSTALTLLQAGRISIASVF